MTLYSDIKASCEAQGLEVFAALECGPNDKAPNGAQTLLLLGPREPGFWARVTEAPEFSLPDPLDRWSERVIGALAQEWNACAAFPFGGPPHHPFIDWAINSGFVWSSPVNLLVHDKAGLFVSFRGALAFDHEIELPKPPGARPCDTCTEKPCLTACPAAALTAGNYDVNACHQYLDAREGSVCLAKGCIVRRTCPAGLGYARLAEQSAHHMSFFHKKVDP